MLHRVMIAYYNGRYLQKEEIAISPDDRGFLFGDGVYEVIRAYPEGLFELEAHLERLEESLEKTRISGVDQAEIRRMCTRLLEENALVGKDAKIYLQITRGVAPRDHVFPEPGVKPTVYGIASPAARPEEEQEKGIPAVLFSDSRWGRCDIKSVCLMPNVLAAQAAHEGGAHEAILVRDGVVTEGTHTSVFAVVDGTLQTHPLSNLILPGVTRMVVLRLCRQEDIPVKLFPITPQQLRDCEEAFVAGTTSEIVPVVLLDGRPVGGGTPGPVTRRLQKAFARHVSSVSAKPGVSAEPAGRGSHWTDGHV